MPPPRDPGEFLERTSTPEGEIGLLNEAIAQRPTQAGIEWLDMVRRGRSGDPIYEELANRPLIKTLEQMTAAVMVPLPDNFTSPVRTPWGGRLILEEIKTDIGRPSEPNVVGESWEISGHRSIPNHFMLRYAGKEIAVPIMIFDKLFSDEMYGRKSSFSCLPFIVKLVNSGSWRSYADELKDILGWIDGTEYASTWRKSLGADCAFRNMLSWNHHELHRAILRLKMLLLQKILSASDRSQNAPIWRQSLSVSSLENLKGMNATDLINSLGLLSTMQQAGGLVKEAEETNYLIRLFTVHQKMLTKNLSVQVHPTKDYRGMSPGEHSKSEAWIILGAEPGAGIYLGLKEKVSKEQFESSLRNGEDVMHLLNFIPVKAGDVFFIPAGTMHAIGAGVLLMEPQETSETTYRVYDYGRVDSQGRTRNLNIEGAMAVTDWNGKRGEDAVQWYRRTPEEIRPDNGSVAGVERILNEKVFETYRLTFTRGAEHRGDTLGSVQAFTVIEGAVEVYKGNEQTPTGVYRRGQSFIVPASMGAYRMVGLSDRSTLYMNTVYTPYGSATSKPTSSISAVIAQQSPEMQARNNAFIARPSRGHILMVNPQGYAGPTPPLSAPDTGGQVEYVNYKARELARLGYKVTIAARAFRPEPEYAVHGDRKGVDFLPRTGDMVRYVFVPGLQEKDAPFFLKEEREFYSELPTMARNLSLWISDEAEVLNVNPWEYYLYLDTHYVDGGIVGQRLVRIWDHLFVSKYLRERFGEILKHQMDPDPFEDDNVMNSVSYNFGRRVLTAWSDITGFKPRYGVEPDILAILKWAAETSEWPKERIDRLLANPMTDFRGNGRNMAPDKFVAFDIGYRLLEASGEWQRLSRLIRRLNRHAWTVHSLGQLKEDRTIADGVHQDDPKQFRELNFPTRIAAEYELLRGPASGGELSGEIFQGMPAAKVIVLTSPDIAETAIRQGMPASKATINFVPGTDPERYHARLSINDHEVQHLFQDAVARGVMPQSVVTGLLEHPHEFNIIVDAGRMDKTKRKHLLIEAMAKLPSNTILLITGKRDKKGVYDGLVNRIARLGLQNRVFLLGMVPDIAMGPLMSLPHGENEDQFRIAITASASRMEGWGMAVEDGTRGGMPLVASDRVPYAVLLKERDDAAIVVRSGDGEDAEVARYAEALNSLVSNPPLARQMAKRALEIAQEYEWRVLTENATAQLMGILSQSNEPHTSIIVGGTMAVSPKHVVIIAGGHGTRFRPYSSDEMPKQFLPITERGRSMLQMTADRFRGVIPATNMWVATNSRQVGLVRGQLPEVGIGNIIGEPIKRNTAPAIASIMYWISRHDPDAVVAVVPSDHFIGSAERFVVQMKEAFEFASVTGGLVTFGIPPTWASPEYGYIQLGGTDPVYTRFHGARSFKEKPDPQTAQRYLDGGNYLWNSGMFVWSARSFMQHLAHYQPVMTAGLEAVYGRNPMEMTLTPEMMYPYFNALNPISIDYALMEPAAQDGRVFVLPLATEWSDVGTWQSLAQLVREGKADPPEEVVKLMTEILQNGGSAK